MRRIKTVILVIAIWCFASFAIITTGNVGLTVIRSISTLLPTTVFSKTYDTATPAGSDNPAEADDRMREIKAAVQERMAVDHEWELDGTQVSDANTGEHKKVLFTAPIPAAQTVAAGKGVLRVKDVNDQAELHWTDEAENELQLTSLGNNLARGQWLTSSDVAGTGTVNLIKADSNNVAVIPNNSQTATNAAPTSTAGIANKKYVDDLALLDPSTYAGEGSITFPNGLVLKHGTVVAGDDDVPVDFTDEGLTDFDNAVVSVTVGQVGTDVVNDATTIGQVGITGFRIHSSAGGGSISSYYWQAWGY